VPVFDDREAATSQGKSLRELEWLAIQAALERHSGNKLAASAELGISLKTLYNRLNEAAESRKAA
jgi:two-component system NtrC family response regulator